MNPDKAYDLLREAIPRRPELRWKCWPAKLAFDATERNKDWHPYKGFCYIATQVFCNLVPESKPYSNGRSHFWAQIGDSIYDPTADQFPYTYEYESGKRTRFKRLTKRAEALLEECLTIQSCIRRV